MTTITPAAALGESTFCLDCGRPYLISEGHACSGPRREAVRPAAAQLADLRRHVASLDRGVVEAGTTASRALATADALKRHQAEQRKLRELQREGEEAIERSLSRPVPSRRQPARSRPRSARPVSARPSLTALPGGAA